MKDEQQRARCVACGWHTEYADADTAHTVAADHDKAAHNGERTAVVVSQSGVVHG